MWACALWGWVTLVRSGPVLGWPWPTASQTFTILIWTTLCIFPSLAKCPRGTKHCVRTMGLNWCICQLVAIHFSKGYFLCGPFVFQVLGVTGKLAEEKHSLSLERLCFPLTLNRKTNNRWHTTTRSYLRGYLRMLGMEFYQWMGFNPLLLPSLPTPLNLSSFNWIFSFNSLSSSKIRTNCPLQYKQTCNLHTVYNHIIMGVHN